MQFKACTDKLEQTNGTHSLADILESQAAALNGGEESVLAPLLAVRFIFSSMCGEHHFVCQVAAFTQILIQHQPTRVHAVAYSLVG